MPFLTQTSPFGVAVAQLIEALDISYQKIAGLIPGEDANSAVAPSSMFSYPSNHPPKGINKVV